MISLLYTTARPYLIQPVLDVWRERARDWDQIEVVLVTDDPLDIDYPRLRYQHNSGRRDCVTGWNLAASLAQGSTFVQVSDDLFPPPEWDEAIRGFVEGKQAVSLLLPDERGSVPAVFHPVLTRGAYEHFGYLYPPDFRSMFCDVWFYHAHLQAGFLLGMKGDAFWHHRHRSTYDLQEDDVTRVHESDERYAEGRKVLRREAKKLGILIKFGEGN
ncbi:MAG: glycosyltransferase family A protein [Pseudomonadota bacterium]